jgi:hypothetical protein
MTTSGTGEGDAIVDFDPEELLDDDAKRDIVSDAPSIIHITIQPSSEFVGDHGLTIIA